MQLDESLLTKSGGILPQDVALLKIKLAFFFFFKDLGFVEALQILAPLKIY